MADEKKSVAENGKEKKNRLELKKIFYHNTFVLIFSFIVALVAWFVMASESTESNTIITDVPITVSYSPAAEEDGLRVFNMSYNSADLEISGSSLITNKLTSDDFEVSVTLNPTSTKLTGNTMQKMTLPVRAVKTSAVSDYTIASVNPEEVNVEYDRYKEVTLSIENDVKFSADTGFVSGTVTLSEAEVTVSGPESSVNRISRAAVDYSVENPLSSDASFTCPVRLYDQDNQELEDTAGMYLLMSVDTVDVTIPILPKKTVTVKASTLNQPKGFSDSRITVEPAEIEIAGPADVLSGITEITLDTAINFADLDVGQKNVITLDIPLPTGVRDLSASGENSVSQATVSVNLIGYQRVNVTVPSDNFQLVNPPAGREAVISNRTLEVSVVGSDAQVSKLTGDALSVQLDLANFSDRTGTVTVPATVTITGSGTDSCWVVGKYSMSVSITDAVEAAAQTDDGQQSGSSEAVNAVPQE